MTKILLAEILLLALVGGVFEPASVRDSNPGRKVNAIRQSPAPTSIPTPPSQDSLRPPASWQDQLGPRPKVTELYVGSKPESHWIFKPRKDLPAWDASLPIDWSADPFQDINWQHRLHSWSSMDFWMHEYMRDSDPDHLSAPIQIALDWHRFHIEEGRTSALQWYDHSSGVRASRLAFLLGFILSDQLKVSDVDLARLMTLADLHAEKLMDPAFLSPTNHGLFQMVGLDALCSVVGWRGVCQGARPYAKESFVDLVKSWYSEEGVHVENSPTYHSWVTLQIRELGAVERFGHPDIQKILDRADALAPWLTYPDGRWARVGDSHGDGPQLTGPVEPECLPNGGGCWAVRDFTKSGYAVIRSLPEVDESDASMLFVSGTTEPTGHKHGDDLGFVQIEGGQDIFVDSGRYGYNYDEYRSYVLSARAHNVISLVGRRTDPYNINPADSRLEPILVEEGRFKIKGVVDRPYLFVHERTFSYVPGTSLRIEDKLNNLTDLHWQSNLHLAPDLIPEITEMGFVVSADDFTVRGEFSGEGCEVSAVRGKTEPYQGWVSVGYLEMTPASVVIATCPPELVKSSWQISFER